MTSANHEGLVELLRSKPAFGAQLLRDLLGIDVPWGSHARLSEETHRKFPSITRHADAVILFDGGASKRRPVFGSIFEVQLYRESRKRYSWPFYAVAARARYKCPFVVTVVTLDAKIARWAARPINLGDQSIFQPRVIGPANVPRVTDREQALRHPQLAMLSVLVHGGGEVDTAVLIGRAAIHAISLLPDDPRLLYCDLIEHALSNAARKALIMDPETGKFFSVTNRKAYARGKAQGASQAQAKAKAEGRAEGLASWLLICVKRRGLTPSAKQHHQIASCTDVATLHRWLDRVPAAASVADLLSSPSSIRSSSSSARRSNGHVIKAKPKARSRR